MVVRVIRYLFSIINSLNLIVTFLDERLQYLCEVFKITLTIFQYKVS